ncbi:hypothetical protein [Bacteriophage Eos]|nr:hypothetical protein [Bacteriophage Eos]
MKLHETLVVPDDVNLFFVGDIHGEHDMLEDALKLAGHKEKDYVVCVGDLIDRGPKNLQVLAKFLFNPRFRSVIGNHDAFMMFGDYANWMYNGGMWAMNDMDHDTIKGLARDMLDKMPFMMTVEHRGKRYGVVHAAVPFVYKETGMDVVTPEWDKIVNGLSEKFKYGEQEPYIWDRDVIREVAFNMALEGKTEGDPYFDKYTAGFKEFTRVTVPPVLGVDLVFHGHTGVPFPFKYENRVYLDTGGTFNGAMTVASPVNDQLYCFTTDKNDPCGKVRII